MLRATTDLTADTVRISAPSTSQFAANISQLVWPSNQVFWRPGAVVLLPLARWREAVAGVPLMHFPNNAALLGTPTDRLLKTTSNEIIRLQPPARGVHGERLPAQVFLVGAISSAVAQAVRKLGFTTTRVRGDNSIETAAEVAREVARHMPNPPSILVPYNSPIDSQPAVALAAHQGAPILFLNHSSVPEETASVLKDIVPSAVYILGRNTQLSTSLVNQVQSLLPEQRVIRVGGESTSDYAVNVARYQDPVNNFGWGRTGRAGDVFTFVASGNICQSIFAATLSHLATHAPQLIIPSEQGIPERISEYLTSVNPPLFDPPRPPFMRGWIIGERKDISLEQQIELESLLIKENGDWPPAG